MWNNPRAQELTSLSPPGYANEVGEAFRSLVPAAVVWLSYGVSSSYVLADAIDKGKKTRDVSVNLPLNPSPWPAPPCGQSTALHMVESLVGQSVPTTWPGTLSFVGSDPRPQSCG